MNQNEIQIKEIESKIGYVLGLTYNHIPWSKIKVKSSYKFYLDRIRASYNTQNFKEFWEVLCKKLGIEMIKIETDVLDFLDAESACTMQLLRKETLYLGNLGIEVAKQLKEERKQQKEEKEEE